MSNSPILTEYSVIFPLTINEFRFNFNFLSCIKPLCSCSLEIESASQFLMPCHYFSSISSNPLNSLMKIKHISKEIKILNEF